MTFVDLGEKMGKDACCPVSPGDKGKDRIHYPTLYINKGKPPPFKIGASMEAKVKLKLVGVNKRQGDKYHCDFEVHAIDFGTKSTDEEELGEEVGRQLKKKGD